MRCALVGNNFIVIASTTQTTSVTVASPSTTSTGKIGGERVLFRYGVLLWTWFTSALVLLIFSIKPQRLALLIEFVRVEKFLTSKWVLSIATTIWMTAVTMYAIPLSTCFDSACILCEFVHGSKISVSVCNGPKAYLRMVFLVVLCVPLAKIGTLCVFWRTRAGPTLNASVWNVLEQVHRGGGERMNAIACLNWHTSHILVCSTRAGCTCDGMGDGLLVR